MESMRVRPPHSCLLIFLALSADAQDLPSASLSSLNSESLLANLTEEEGGTRKNKKSGGNNGYQLALVVSVAIIIILVVILILCLRRKREARGDNSTAHDDNPSQVVSPAGGDNKEEEEEEEMRSRDPNGPTVRFDLGDTKPSLNDKRVNSIRSIRVMQKNRTVDSAADLLRQRNKQELAALGGNTESVDSQISADLMRKMGWTQTRTGYTISSSAGEDGESPHQNTSSEAIVAKKRDKAILECLREEKYVQGQVVRKEPGSSSSTIFLELGATLLMKETFIDGNFDDENPEKVKILKRAITGAKKEADLARAIRHRNVLRVYAAAFSPQEKRVVVYSEFCSGQSLRDKVRGLPACLSEIQGKGYIRQLVKALRTVHGGNMIHRDLRCDNIVVQEDGEIKLMGFGLAASIATMTKSSTQSINSNFCAPELFKGVEEGGGYTTKSDIWSLGVLTCEMFGRGQIPWPRFGTEFALMNYIGNKGKPPTIPVEAKLSDNCKNFILLCCQKDQSDRPTAEDLLAHEWLGGGGGTLLAAQHHLGGGSDGSNHDQETTASASGGGRGYESSGVDSSVDGTVELDQLSLGISLGHAQSLTGSSGAEEP